MTLDPPLFVHHVFDYIALVLKANPAKPWGSKRVLEPNRIALAMLPRPRQYERIDGLSIAQPTVTRPMGYTARRQSFSGRKTMTPTRAVSSSREATTQKGSPREEAWGHSTCTETRRTTELPGTAGRIARASSQSQHRCPRLSRQARRAPPLRG